MPAQSVAGAHGESLVYPFQNGAVHIVEQGIGGIVIGLVYGQDLAIPPGKEAAGHHEKKPGSAEPNRV